MLLRLDQISKRHAGPRGPRVALEGVSLQVDRGQIVGIYGASGAGKSSLLRIAAGMLMPDSGDVIYDGRRLCELPGRERVRLRRREIACVWERCEESRLRVIDHVAMPLLIDRVEHRTAQRRAKEALLACEVDHLAPVELDQLSEGERQRVTIARALVIEPRLLLADSPASRLSIVEQEAIISLLRALSHEANVAVLIAERDAQALIGADTVLCLSEGRLIQAPAEREGNVVALPLRPRRASSRR